MLCELIIKTIEDTAISMKIPSNVQRSVGRKITTNFTCLNEGITKHEAISGLSLDPNITTETVVVSACDPKLQSSLLSSHSHLFPDPYNEPQYRAKVLSDLDSPKFDTKSCLTSSSILNKADKPIIGSYSLYTPGCITPVINSTASQIKKQDESTKSNTGLFIEPKKRELCKKRNKYLAPGKKKKVATNDTYGVHNMIMTSEIKRLGEGISDNLHKNNIKIRVPEFHINGETFNTNSEKSKVLCDSKEFEGDDEPLEQDSDEHYAALHQRYELEEIFRKYLPEGDMLDCVLKQGLKVWIEMPNCSTSLPTLLK